MFRIKVPANSAVVRTGWGGLKVVTGRAASVRCLPWIHKHSIVTFTSKNLQLEIPGSESVLSKDELVVTCQAKVVLSSLRDQASILQQLRSGASDKKSSSPIDAMLQRKCTSAIKEIVTGSDYGELQGGLLLNDEQSLSRLSAQIKSQGFAVETLQIGNVQLADDSDLDEGNFTHLKTIQLKAEKKRQREEENRAKRIAADNALREERAKELIQETENKKEARLETLAAKTREIRAKITGENEQELQVAREKHREVENWDPTKLKQEIEFDSKKKTNNPADDRHGQPRSRTVVPGKQAIVFPAGADAETRIEIADEQERERKEKFLNAYKEKEEPSKEDIKQRQRALTIERAKQTNSRYWKWISRIWEGDSSVEFDQNLFEYLQAEDISEETLLTKSVDNIRETAEQWKDDKDEAQQEEENKERRDKLTVAERAMIEAEEDHRNAIERAAIYTEHSQLLASVTDPTLIKSDDWKAARKAELDLKLAEQDDIEARRLAERLDQQERKEAQALEADKRGVARDKVLRIVQRDSQKGALKREKNDEKRNNTVAEAAKLQAGTGEDYEKHRKKRDEIYQVQREKDERTEFIDNARPRADHDLNQTTALYESLTGSPPGEKPSTGDQESGRPAVPPAPLADEASAASAEKDLEANRLRNLKLADDDLKVADDDLKLADDDLKLADDDLKLADDDLKVADDDLKLADDDLKLADDDLKLADDDLKLADDDDLTFGDFGDTE